MTISPRSSRRPRINVIRLAHGEGLQLPAYQTPGSAGLDLVAAVPHWFWAKLILVLGLSGYHGFLSAEGRKLAAGQRRHSERYWRLMSEIPFLVAIAVVLLATLEP